jgi:hypothetical protein
MYANHHHHHYHQLVINQLLADLCVDGDGIWRCLVIPCKRYGNAFPDKAAYDKHQAEIHGPGVRLWTCPIERCTIGPGGPMRYTSKWQHEARHKTEDYPWKCPKRNCPYETIGFPVKDALVRHMRSHSHLPPNQPSLVSGWKE